MQSCIIFNPTARGHKAQKLAELLQSLGRHCHYEPTFYPGEARLFALNAVEQGYETIIAAGGDGTVNEVLNGIGDAPDGFTKARLAILPLGTINVFARELQIPLNLEQAWRVAQIGRETTIDLPKAEFQSEGKITTRYFAQLAGAGLDSNAVAMVNMELKKKLGSLAYVASGLKSLRGPQSNIWASTTAGSISGEMVLIGNGRYYGGNIRMFSEADLRDGKLDVCVFPKVNWQSPVRAGIGLMTGNVHRFCGAQELQTHSIALSADRKTLLQLDGENVGELPAKFSIQPRLLRVIVP